MPSPTLFAALVIGLAAALALPRANLAMPAPAFIAAQALVGVTIGAYLKSDALKALAGDWLPVLIVSAATLGLSIGSGWALARWTELDRPTATLGMIAGGASGIVTMADELGADDRLVAFMQYVRVLVVVLLTPILIAIFGGGEISTRRARSRRLRPTARLADRGADRAARRARRPRPPRPGGHPARTDARLRRAHARRRGLQHAAGAQGALVRADRPAGRPALHARHRAPARAPADPGARRGRRAARSAASRSRSCSSGRPTSRCATPTSRPPPAASTPCWRSPSAPAPTPRSSSASRPCACSSPCCSHRSRCAG